MISNFDIDEESVRSAREESILALKALREGNKIINQKIRKPLNKSNANTANIDRNEKSVNFIESKEKKINRIQSNNNMQNKKVSHVVNVKEDVATNIRVPTLLKSPMIFYENALNTFEEVDKNNSISIPPYLTNPEHSANENRFDDNYRSKKNEPKSHLSPNLYSWLAKEENIKSHNYVPLLPYSTKETAQPSSPRMDTVGDRADTIISESNQRFHWQLAEEQQPKRVIRGQQNPITLDHQSMDPFQYMSTRHSFKSHAPQNTAMDMSTYYSTNDNNNGSSSRQLPQYGVPYDDQAIPAAGVSTGATSQAPPPSFFAWNIQSDYQINQTTRPQSSTTTQTDILHSLTSQHQQSTPPKVEVGIQTADLFPPPPPPSTSQPRQEHQISQESYKTTKKTNPVTFTAQKAKPVITFPEKQLASSKSPKNKNILSDYPSVSSHTLSRQYFTKGMPFDKRVMTRATSAPSLLSLRPQAQARQLSEAASHQNNSSYIKERSWKALGGWGHPPPPPAPPAPPARLQGRKALDTRDITSNKTEYWESETPSAIDSARDRFEPSDDISGSGSASFASAPAPLLDKLSRWSPTPDHAHYDPNRDSNRSTSSMGAGGGMSRPFGDEGTVSDVSHSIATTSTTRQIESAARAKKLADEVRRKDRQKAFYETPQSSHMDENGKGRRDAYIRNQSLDKYPKKQQQQQQRDVHQRLSYNNKRSSAEEVSQVATADSSALWEDTFSSSSSSNNNNSRRRQGGGGGSPPVRPADPQRPWQQRQVSAHRGGGDGHTSMAIVRSADQDAGSTASGRGSSGSAAWTSTTASTTATASDRTPAEHRHRRRVGLADFHRAKVPLEKSRSTSYHRKSKESPAVHWLDHPTAEDARGAILRPKSAPVGRRKMSTVEGKYGWSQYQRRYPLESEQQTRRWKSETANQFNKNALIDRSLHLDC